MPLKGINYDVGSQTGPFLSRPVFDPAATARDLAVIRDELHCEAVRISGTDEGRLIAAADLALRAGLAVWLSPALHDGTPAETLAHTRRVAAAARELGADRVTYLLGCELTMFMRGIMPGATIFERLRPDRMLRLRYLKRHNRPLNAFLAEAARAVRAVWDGPLGYASAPIEAVDWAPFDLVAVDYYRGRRNRDDYGERLRRHFAHGRPVYVTEVGCATYCGAEHRGGTAWAIVDPRDPDRLGGDYVRDERRQAGEVVDMLGVLEREGVAGAFVFTFAAPALPHRADPRRDLDLASYAVVRSYDDGHWEPKELFHRLAERNA